MSFTTAIRSVLQQYVGFTGRARRSELWWWVLFYFLVDLVAGILDGIVGISLFGLSRLLEDSLGDGAVDVTVNAGDGPFGTIVFLGLLLPTLAVAIRRLHDTGRSGWWLLIGLVPLVGPIVLLVFFLFDSSPGSNAHGPSPKQPTSLPA